MCYILKYRQFNYCTFDTLSFRYCNMTGVWAFAVLLFFCYVITIYTWEEGDVDDLKQTIHYNTVASVTLVNKV